MNVITSTLTHKLSLFDIDNDTFTNNFYHDHTYANLRKKRLSVIYGYCDQDNDYIFSTDLKHLIFAYYNSMLSWSISGEAMKQFRNAEHKQVMIGPQLGLEGATLAIGIHAGGRALLAIGVN